MNRRLAQIPVFLLVGAAVNLAIAWGLALWSPLSGSERPSDSAMAAIREEIPAAWGLRVDSSISGFFRGENGDRWLSMDRESSGFGVHHQMVGAQWHPHVGIPILIFPSQVHVLRAGWPMYSLRCRGIFVRSGRGTSAGWAEDWSGSVAASGLRPQSVNLGVWASGSYERRLPTVVLWSGFLANTLCYATLAWLLLVAPFEFRRWRRLRHGRCPCCAYPVGTSIVCTECGKALPPRLVSERH